MKRAIVVIIALLFLSGCLMRTYTVEKERKYTEVTGNRGYIMGQPKEEPPKESRLGKTRKMTVVEFEFGPQSEPKSKRMPKALDQETEQRFKDKTRELAAGMDVADDIDEEILREEFADEDDIEIIREEVQELKPEYEYYTIQTNDTLQKISKKFYGTTRKWRDIYELNRHIIKDPDKVYPGKEIKIPLMR